MHDITFRNQISMKENPTKAEHLITKEYLDQTIEEQNPKVWGVIIDTTNSDPDTSVVFSDDCLTSGPPTDFGERPCMLKDGKVQYFLDKNDYSKKEDGSNADITSGEDGHVMIEIPKLAYMIKRDGDYLKVKITKSKKAKSIDPNFCYYGHTMDDEGDLNNIYIGAYLTTVINGRFETLSGRIPERGETITAARIRAQSSGPGYDLFSFYPLTLLQCMFLVKYKSLDSQRSLGKGFTGPGNANVTRTGGTDNTGMYYGTNNGRVQIKFAGIEDLWGNTSSFIDGLQVGSAGEILTSFGNGYINKSEPLADAMGYLSKVIGNNLFGFMALECQGSSTTYYSDIVYKQPATIPHLRSDYTSGGGGGLFNFSFGISTTTDGALSQRLMFRSKT